VAVSEIELPSLVSFEVVELLLEVSFAVDVELLSAEVEFLSLSVVEASSV